MRPRSGIGILADCPELPHSFNIDRIIDAHQFLTGHSEVYNQVFHHGIRETHDHICPPVEMTIKPGPESRVRPLLLQNRTDDRGLTDEQPCTRWKERFGE